MFDAVDFDGCLAIDNISRLFHGGMSVRYRPGMAFDIAIDYFHVPRAVYAWSDQTIVFGPTMVGGAV